VESPTITLVDPTREGYTFEGWQEGSEIVQGSIGNKTFTATWKVNQYTISFESNGGNEVNSIMQDFDTPVLEPTEPTRNGYVFGGWHSDAGLSTPYVFTTIPAEDITLYAKWDIVTYDINYVLEGGTNGSNPSTYTVESPTITLVDPTREGYTFEGWQEGSEIVQGSIGNKTFTAIWIIDQINVSYYVYDNFQYDAFLFDANEEISQISLGEEHSAVLTSQGRILIWGGNSYGEIGDGTTIDKSTPIDITDAFNLHANEKIISISLGWWFSSALTSEGRVFTWGANFAGQIGDGTTISQSVPVDITTRFNLEQDETIVSIDVGYAHCIALSSNGRVFTWGYNDFGQLGDNTVVDKHYPMDITSRFSLNIDEKISIISAGLDHNLVITSDNRIFGWGNNMNGALADGTAISKYTPTDLTMYFSFNEGESINEVNSDERYSSLITSNHRVFVWGVNDYGQLGDGTNEFRYSPVEITSQFNLQPGEVIVQMVAGKRISIAMTSEKRVFMWGANYANQLGDGTTNNMNTPIEITSRFDLGDNEFITMVYSGGNHSLAVTSRNNVFTWGWNGYGQLGFGLYPERTGEPSLAYLYPAALENYIIYDANVGLTEYMPERTGFIFSGWFVDKDMTVPYVFSSFIDNSLVLYGYWTVIE
jgi:uncharacterized repeat protein (TIGR02543 family)